MVFKMVDMSTCSGQWSPSSTSSFVPQHVPPIWKATAHSCTSQQPTLSPDRSARKMLDQTDLQERCLTSYSVGPRESVGASKEDILVGSTSMPNTTSPSSKRRGRGDVGLSVGIGGRPCSFSVATTPRRDNDSDNIQRDSSTGMDSSQSLPSALNTGLVWSRPVSQEQKQRGVGGLHHRPADNGEHVIARVVRGAGEMNEDEKQVLDECISGGYFCALNCF